MSLACEICYEFYAEYPPERVPRLLPQCGHDFCTRCIHALCATTDGDGPACPKCRVRLGTGIDIKNGLPVLRCLLKLDERLDFTGSPPPLLVYRALDAAPSEMLQLQLDQRRAADLLDRLPTDVLKQLLEGRCRSTARSDHNNNNNTAPPMSPTVSQDDGTAMIASWEALPAATAADVPKHQPRQPTLPPNPDVPIKHIIAQMVGTPTSTVAGTTPLASSSSTLLFTPCHLSSPPCVETPHCCGDDVDPRHHRRVIGRTCSCCRGDCSNCHREAGKHAQRTASYCPQAMMGGYDYQLWWSVPSGTAAVLAPPPPRRGWPYPTNVFPCACMHHAGCFCTRASRSTYVPILRSTVACIHTVLMCLGRCMLALFQQIPRAASAVASLFQSIEREQRIQLVMMANAIPLLIGSLYVFLNPAVFVQIRSRGGA